MKKEPIRCGIYIYTHRGILLSCKKKKKKNEKFAICRNMDRLEGHYPKENKSGKEKQILHAITYMWNLKNTKK